MLISLPSYYKVAADDVWTPAELFAQGELGLWSDAELTYEGKQVLWQDARCTVPTTEASASIRAIFDIRTGLALGQNLLASFDISSFALSARVKDVTANSFTVADGESDGSVVSRAGDTGGNYNAVVSYTRLSAGGDIALTVGSVSSVDEQVRQTMGESGTIMAQARQASGDNTLFIRLYGAGASVRIDDIQLREVTGGHGYAPNAASRPAYSETPPRHVYDGIDDQIVFSFPPIAAATVAIATTSGADIQYPVDLSSGEYTINESNSGIIIREGELTAGEHQNVTAYLNELAGIT